MNYTNIPVITILCYLSGEIYKVVFKKKEELYKLIPVLVTLLGGVFGAMMHYVDSSYLDVESIISALEIGLLSGSAATGMHQLIKQLIKQN